MATPEFTPILIAPKDNASFTCVYSKPSDWADGDIPAQQTDFSDPQTFQTLGGCQSVYGYGAFVIGARPAWTEGSMFDFAEGMLKGSGLEVDPLFDHQIDGCRALRAEGRQEFDGVALITRFQFVEGDGVYFVNVGTIPEELAQHFAPALDGMFASFSIPNAPQDDDRAVPARGYRCVGSGNENACRLDDGGRRAFLQRDAGREERGIVIEMHKRDRAGCTIAQIADALKLRYQTHEPEIETMRMRIADLECLALRNAQRGGKPVVKAILFKDSDDMVIEICVTAPPEEMTLAMNVMEEMVSSMRALVRA